MAIEDEFDPALLRFANAAWSIRESVRKKIKEWGETQPNERTSHPSDLIYDLYNGSEIARRSFDSVTDAHDELKAYLKRLLRIAANTTTELTVGVSIQDFDDFDLRLVAETYPAQLDAMETFEKDDAETRKRTISSPKGTDLWNTFYHFYVSESDSVGVRHRIYVHAKDCDTSCHILERLVKHLVHHHKEFRQRRLEPRFDEVKIIGPGGNNRMDQIVAYFTKRDSVEHALKVLKELPEKWFEDGVPRGVRERSKGVGTADEPARVSLLDDDESNSFGIFLSHLIYISIKAVTTVSGPETETRFLEVLKFMLEQVRLDPKYPHLHTHRDIVEEWYSVTLRVPKPPQGQNWQPAQSLEKLVWPSD